MVVEDYNILITDAFRVGSSNVVTIYLFGGSKMIQYMVVEDQPSIYRYRICDMKVPLSVKQSHPELTELS